MDRLEKFISENEDLFHDSEPAEGHFMRFNAKLEKEARVMPVRNRRNVILKVAAAVLFLVTGSAIVFQLAFNRFDIGTGEGSTRPGISAEIQDALLYYDNQTDSRLKEFNRLACCGEEQTRLNNMVASELNAIDANVEELKQALKNDPDNENIQAAIIRNQQMKNQVLDNVIEQIRKAKYE